MSLLRVCQWLEETSLSVAIRESSWGFPIIESAHVLGLCLFGMAVLVDLRVLDVALNRVPLSEVTTELTPWATAGIAVVVISGVLTFLNAPVEYYKDTFFRVKIFLLLLVVVNMWILGRVWRTPSLRGLSLLLWAGVVVAGRMITYHLVGTQ
jgi:hypothetical protein